MDGQEAAPAGGYSRRRALFWILGGAGGISLLGLEASRWVKSPQQAAADTMAPPPSTLTAAVEKRVLRDTVVLRGKVAAGGSFEVTPTPAAGLPIVTRVHVKAGESIPAAVALVEVAGRPLFALPGQVPVFRDLRPGSQGEDIAQLQAALRAVGHDPGENQGHFGPGTKKAVAALYKRLGYDAPVTGEHDGEALEAAAKVVREARRRLTEAKAGLESLLLVPPPSPKPGEPDPIAKARLAVAYAEEELSAATVAEASLIAHTGVMIPASEVVFLPAFPARVDQLNARVGAPAQAPLITLSSGSLVVRAQLNPAQRQLLRPGMRVEVVSELTRVTAKASIETIGELEQDAGNGNRFHPMVVVPAEGDFDPKLAGQDVRLTVEAAATHDEVLVVPLAALYANADGSTCVIVLPAGQGARRITVLPGVSGDGYVSVESADGILQPGALVQIGSGDSGNAGPGGENK